MPGRRPAAVVVCIAVIIAALAAVAACGGSGVGQGAASAIATSTALEKAKAQLNMCIAKTGATALVHSSGRAEFASCMQSLVPPAKQEQFRNCITSAAASDRLWTSPGRTTFTNQSLPDCLNQAV